MIFIDRREHGLGCHDDDKEKPLARYNLPITVTELEFGDAMWEGEGPGGRTVTVGVERKRLSDLIKCMQDRRLSGHQLPGLNATYEYVYLVVEELMRSGSGGEIEVWGWLPQEKKNGWKPFYTLGPERERTSVNYRQVITYLHSLSLRAVTTYGEPWRVIRTGTPAATAAEYASLYHMWQKPWDEHKSHDAIYCAGVPKKGHGTGWATEHGHENDEMFVPGRVGVFQSTTQKPPSTLLRMAMQLPGISERAKVVAMYFGSVQKMAEASEEEWMAIDFGMTRDGSRRRPGIGKLTATAVVRAIRESGA